MLTFRDVPYPSDFVLELCYTNFLGDFTAITPFNCAGILRKLGEQKWSVKDHIFMRACYDAEIQEIVEEVGRC